MKDQHIDFFYLNMYEVYLVLAFRYIYATNPLIPAKLDTCIIEEIELKVGNFSRPVPNLFRDI